MTTPQELEAQIYREDILPFNNGVYDGYLPEEFVDQFRIAMMMIPVTSHQYSMDDVERLSLRRPGEITRLELGMMLNVVFAVPWASMYGSIEEGIEKTRNYERIKREYNEESEAFQVKCRKKLSRLLKLSGISNSTPMINGNGLQVVPK